MSTISFSFARTNDAQAIMRFMDEHWRKRHVLSWNKDLLLKDFQDQKQSDRLNFGLAKDSEGHLLALFGFIFYNQNDLPDMAGSLWKVTDEAQKDHPMLGIQLRNFVIKNIPHRFFAAPGAGLQTETIYQVIRMNWHRMQQYFRLNPNLAEYHLVQCPAAQPKKTIQAKVELIKVQKETAETQLSAFDFEVFPEIVPHKDRAYLLRRYFDYPFYDYDVYLVKQTEDPSLADFAESKPVKSIVVCRRAVAEVEDEQCEKHYPTAYRMVDFLGEEALMPEIIEALALKMVEAGDEYLDFICHGFDEDLMKQGGMQALDFDSEECIVPNFFEPLLMKNVPVYCVSDKTDLHFRQCKADGDQDRPNGIKLAKG